MAKWRISAIPYQDRPGFRRGGIFFPTYPNYLELDEKEVPRSVWEESSLIKERISEKIESSMSVEEKKKKKEEKDDGSA